jgi:hypothetical protein
MDDVARLRRTVRRCTALLLAGIGLATWTIGDFGDGASNGFLLALPALLYLAGSLVYEPDQRADDRRNAGT